MKFSVLLPTRNRLDLLMLAIESVRMQDFTDWEILVSDNASDEDVAADVRKLSDSRIKTRRFGRLMPVTDNWNAALEIASGDYLIMLGDDDVLVPGALARAKDLINAWDSPEAVYAQAHQYAYPGVVPGREHPFVQTGYNAFLEGRDKPFMLSSDIARQMVRAAMSFRILYGFNMQHFVFSRRLVERMKARGPFFQSPYPDYYAANAVFLMAKSVVATPEPICMIGISPKSFGFYYVNSREDDGTAFLHNVMEPDIASRLRRRIVPGTNMNDCWLCAMETLKRNFPEFGLRVNYARYRRLQYHAILHSGKSRPYTRLLRTMRWWDSATLGAIAAVYFLARLLPRGSSRKVRDAISHMLFSRSPRFDPRMAEVPYRNILEAARANAR